MRRTRTFGCPFSLDIETLRWRAAGDAESFAFSCESTALWSPFSSTFSSSSAGRPARWGRHELELFRSPSSLDELLLLLVIVLDLDRLPPPSAPPDAIDPNALTSGCPCAGDMDRLAPTPALNAREAGLIELSDLSLSSRVRLLLLDRGLSTGEA